MEDWPQDEYQSYLPNIYNMVISNAGRKEIAERLFYYESESIGMPGTLENCLLIADKLIKAKTDNED